MARKAEAWTRFSLIAEGLSATPEDHEADIYEAMNIKRRSPRVWMGPYLKSRTDKTQRNTLRKLEEDFLLLGCTREFTRTTRMIPGVHQELLDLVTPLIRRRDTNFRKAISAEERLSLTIRYLTRGDSAFRIKWPFKSGSDFYNYKGFYSMILLAAVDSDYRFIYVGVGSEGKAADSTIFQDSAFGKRLMADDNPLNIPAAEEFPGFQGDLPYYMLGDDAFSLSHRLMKPFPSSKLTMSQRIYNYRIGRGRRCVENTFGILATRFRVLRREIQMEPKSVRDVVMACVVLHNFLKDKMPRTYITRPSTDWEDKDYTVHCGVWRREVPLPGPDKRLTKKNHSLFVKQMRELLTYWMLTKEGECSWQYDIVLRSIFFEE